MAPKVTRTTVWSAKIADQPGGLAETLTALAQSGANLEFVLARRQRAEPTSGVVFVAPLKGRAVLATAGAAGFAESNQIVTLRLEGDDEPGIAARIASAAAVAAVNLRAFCATVTGSRYTCYLGFDSSDDAARVSAALREEFRARP